MKKIDFGQTVSVLANLGVLAGIVLLVYELNLSRELARAQFVNDAIWRYQGIELSVLGSELPAAWAKSLSTPGSLTAAEIKSLDSFLVSYVVHWRRNWQLANEGYRDRAEVERLIRGDAAFVMGNRFAQLWWQEIGQFNEPEFVQLVDSAISDVGPDDNLDWVTEFQRKLSNPE